jgi:small conductance mechanosensitive channel
VDVKPIARDEEIRERLESVLDATDWFAAPEVRLEEGVVFLNGKATTAELEKWAGDLAHNTQGVVAVANRMEVAESSTSDLTPAWSGISKPERFDTEAFAALSRPRSTLRRVLDAADR